MIEKIDKLIQQTIKAYDLPGLAVSLVKDKQVYYAAGFGVGDIETREPITNHSLFH